MTTLHSFGPNEEDGINPTAGLIQAPNGDFYETTYTGGANSDGAVFKMTAAGALTTLHGFDGFGGASRQDWFRAKEELQSLPAGLSRDGGARRARGGV